MRSKSRSKQLGFLRFIGRWALLLIVVAGLAGVFYAIHLDGTVREKFEGKRWALPARVFARKETGGRIRPPVIDS